jgi:glycosyltransferase involved in cell wall biosynthesis
VGKLMNRSVRVLLVTKSTGGVAEYIRWLVQGINRGKFSLLVVCLSENSPEFAEELRQVYDVQAISYAMNRYHVDVISDARVCFQLARLIREHQFDLVHAHASKPGFLARIAALGTGIPVLYSPHCFAFHAGAGRMTILITSFLERLAAFLTTRFVAVSEGERELACQYRVGRQEQIAVIQTGLDPAPYRLPVDIPYLKASLGIPVSAPVIGSVGRLSTQKSPSDFVRVAEAVHRSKPDAHFVWVGDGPLEQDVRNLSASLQLDSTIHWLGQRSDVQKLLHLFDCFILTSRWEGFPLVVLEAMAAGVPVVATNILGTRELIQHGVNGWLAPARDTESLAGLVLDLLTNPGKADAFRQASQARVENEFTRPRMLAMIQNLYEEVAMGMTREIA